VSPERINPHPAPQSPSRAATLFMPHRTRPHSRGSSPSLPADLREQATGRLRITAIVYAAVFFFADFFPAFVTYGVASAFGNPREWLPGTVSIVGALLFAAVVSSSRLRWETKVNLGLVFEVLASFGIAFSMYGSPPGADVPEIVYHVLSPSWVGIWMLFYAIVVPAPPGRALLALVASASAPPLLIASTLHRAGLWPHWTPGMFFFMHVFPYMLCVGMAWIGARIVYRLGADVSRARAIGSYVLVERLGEGGMGEVWRATHQLLARQAAIKFIRPESIAGSNPEHVQMLLKRFQLEARATASLTSVHTIDLYDFGVTEDGRFYYVMELLDGMDGEQLVTRFGPLPAARVVHLLRQVCESLDEAHAKGLIHRDLKPANLYVCRNGRRCDFVKVLDFGLVAHSVAPAPSTNPRLTLPEQAIGTPEFMPPEAALGKVIDGRADLYGLGCAAHWLLTGRAVFEGSSLYDLISKHLNAAPDPPSRHAPAPVPPELDAVILRCLEKDPARRPADARALERELAEIARTLPWSDEQAEAWWAAHLAEGGPAATAPPENVATRA
jgi:serine/threonine-protein kinase